MLLALLAASIPAGINGAARPVSFIIHVQSTYSDDGVLSIEEIVRTARQNGIDAVILNDHDIEKWEYGIRPLRGIVKKTVERTSVLFCGPDNFMNTVAAAGEKYPDTIVIPGVESAPFYYWSGNPFTKNLMLCDWHKHMLIAGIYHPDDYTHLPLIGNEAHAGRFSAVLLWPLALFLAGFAAMKKHRLWGAAALLAGALCAVNNFPFKRLPYDQYHGDRGELPYQTVIDYVNRIAPDTGLVFWAHPEAPNFDTAAKIGPVSFKTPEYPDSLLRTHDYTGFGYFQEGDRNVGKPGGIWDKILMEYIGGQRASPIWAISELDYRNEGNDGTYIDSFKNVIFMRPDDSRTAGTILRSIKAGRFYALAQPHSAGEIRLESFMLSSGGRTATMGERLPKAGNVKMSLMLTASDNSERSLTIKIVANAKIRRIIQAKTPAIITIDLPELTNRSYCRVEVEADNHTRIITNPIFVE